MCGIFGIIGKYDESKAKSALAKLAHRGPDSCDIIQKQNLFFAHQRLSILDINKRANQPLHVENTLLSFNGEIYNYKELKKELSSEYLFTTQSDSEVIIAAYKKWGIDFVNHLRGMFAIALLDNEKLHLFRDRLGKKPLFYIQTKDSFIFASEIKALIPFLQKIEMDEDALLSYLSFLAPTPPFTFFKDIKKLGAGEYLSCEALHVEVQNYYNILDTKPNIIRCRDEAISKLKTTLKESIDMRYNVPKKNNQFQKYLYS